MAIRFDLKVFEQVKTAYMYYLETGRVENQQDLGKFDTYKPYLDADKEIQNLRKEIKSQKEVERRRVEQQKQEALKYAEEKRKAEKEAQLAKQAIKANQKSAKDKKKEKEKILQKLGEIQTQIKAKGKNNISQELLDRYQHFINGIPLEYQNLYQTKISETAKKIRAAQVILYMQPVFLELTSLEREYNEVIFFERLLKLMRTIDSFDLTDNEKASVYNRMGITIQLRIEKKLGRLENVDKKQYEDNVDNQNHIVESLDMSDSERTILISKLNTANTKIEEKIYTQKYLIFSNYIHDWLRKIELSKATIQERRQKLNEVDREIRNSRFDKAEHLSLQKAVSIVRKRLTLIEQGKIVEKTPEVKKQSTKELLSPVIKQNVKTEPHVIIVQWSNIEFGNNVIRITDRDGKFLLAPKEICRKSYNQIKEYLADKLPQIVLVKNQSGVWMLKEPIVFKEALRMIRQKEADDLLQEAQYKEALRSYASMENYLNETKNHELILKRLREKKQNYLNHLIKNQLADYKLVPAVEMIAYESAESIGEEDVFIFTIQTNNFHYRYLDCVNIVYENVNPARASIAFTVEKKYYNQALQSIFNFMNDAKKKNKRSKLRQIVSLNSYIKNLNVVNHSDDMHSWAVSIKK